MAGTHRSQPSLASVDESNKSGASGDEKKTSGISKPAKRMSLAGGTMARASATKVVSATPDRRSTIQSSPPSERKPASRVSTLSPTKSRAPTTPASKSTTTIAHRTTTRPLTSSLRNAGVVEGKKRLSTIPDSPAGKIAASEDDKENTKPARPPLGERQSTRSVVLQQRMREFELVNEMLQAAIAAEDGGDEAKKEQLENEVSGSMTKLKNDLEKVRAFEKQHGRTPTEAELSVEAETERELAVVAAASAKEASEESANLKAELQGSQAKVQALTMQIEEMQLKMTELGLAAEAEATNVQNAKEALQKRIEDMEAQERDRAEQASNDLEDARVNAARTATDAARAEHTSEMEAVAASHSKEVADLLKRLEEAEDREQSRAEQALKDLEEARDTATRAGDLKAEELLKQKEALQLQLDKSDHELKGQGNVIKSLQDELARLKHSNDELEGALRSAHEANAAEHDAQLRNLRQEHEKEIASLASAQDSKEQEIQSLGAVIKRLQEEVRSVHDAKVDEHDAQMQQLKEEHEGVVSSLNAAQHSKEQEIERLGEVIAQLQNEVQSAHDAKAAENEAQIQELKEKHENAISSIKSDHQDDLQTQASQMERQHEAHVSNMKTEHQQALDALANRHEQELQTQKEAVTSTKAELDKVHGAAETSKRESDVLIDKLQAENDASQEAAAQANSALKSTLADLEAARTQVASLKQVLETLEKESVSKDEHHASLLKKAKSEAEEAARALNESDKSELALKHETLISELQAQHDESLSKLRTEIETASAQHATELEAKDDELAKARADLEAESAKQAQDLQAKHDESLTKIRTDMAAAYAQHEDDVRKSNAAKDEVERRLQSELTKAQNDAEESRKLAEELQEKITEAQEEATESSKLAAKLQEDVKESGKLAAELQAEVAKAQQEAEESCKLAEELKTEVANAQDEAKQSSKLAEELQAKVIKAEEDVKESNNLVEELQAQVSKDQQTIIKLTTAAEDASKAIELSNKQEILKQAHESDPEELAMLKEQLDGALQEVETQRALNDKAEEAAEQSKLKIRELEANLKVTKAELTEAKTVRANGVDLVRGPTAEVSSNGSGSPGLGDSKWATADPMTPKTTEGEDRGAAIQGTVCVCKPDITQRVPPVLQVVT
jgi:hypothetical protein